MTRHNAERAILIANGELDEVEYVRALLRPDDYVVVANGGTRNAYTLGRVPDLLVGDGDSLAAPLQAWVREHAVPHHAYHRAKDHTDLELALHHVVERGARHVLLLGGSGGRLDHTIANISLLALSRGAQIAMEMVVGFQHLFLVYDALTIHGTAGQTVSLLPWGGEVTGVSTTGLRWPLSEETLPFGPARGISNLMTEEIATIQVRGGMLLVAHHRHDHA